MEEVALELFESDAYRKPSKIGVRISGTVWLDPDDPNERAMIDQLEPDASINWTLEGVSQGGNWRVHRNSDGQAAGTQFLGLVTVTTVYKA